MLGEQFCSRLHREVVYDSIAHTHRRALHRKAATILKKRLAAGMDMLEARPLLKAMTRHLLASVRRSRGGEGRKYVDLQKEEVDALTDALRQAAWNNQVFGDFKEAISYRVGALPPPSLRSAGVNVCHHNYVWLKLIISDIRIKIV
jgi:hypothetical protein